MGLYKYKLKEVEDKLTIKDKEKLKVGDNTISKGVKYVVTNIDKETGRVEWDVNYLPNFEELFEIATELAKISKGVYVKAKNDPKFREIYEESSNLRNKIRTHIRNEYPEDYKRIVTNIDEMSTTGGGIGAASFTPGTGAQYATPFAFKKSIIKKEKGVKEGYYWNDDIGGLANALGYDNTDEFFTDNPGAVDAVMGWAKSIAATDNEWREMMKVANLLNEDIDLGHEDNEPHMIKSELYRIGKYAMKLYQMMDSVEGMGEVDLPAWWQSKITTAKNMVSSAKHYLEFELKKPEIDAVVDRISDVSPEIEIDEVPVDITLEEELFTPNEIGDESIDRESASGAFEENLDLAKEGMSKEEEVSARELARLAKLPMDQQLKIKKMIAMLKAEKKSKKIKENSIVSKSRAKSSLKQIEKGKRDDGMGKFDAKVFAKKDGKEIELKTLSDLELLDKYSTDYEYMLKGANVPSNIKEFEEIDAELTEASVPLNIAEFAKRKGISSLVRKVAGWAERVGARIAGGTAIGYNYNTLVLDLNYNQQGEIRINTEDETITLYGEYVYSFPKFKEVYEEENNKKGFNWRGIELDETTNSQSVKSTSYNSGQFAYKLVPKKIKGSGIIVKQLFEKEEEEKKNFQLKRIEAFKGVEEKLNNIYAMISNAKNETIKYYKENPNSYVVIKPTDLITDYLEDIEKLLKNK